MPAPTITPLPTPPSRSQSPDTFSTDADAFLGALPDFATEANDQADYLDGLATQVDADATAAVAAASIATGAANYQGDYSAGTTYQIGESVSYNGRRYVAKTVNTGVTPADGANWFLINDGDVLGPLAATDNSIAIYDGATGKLLKSPIGTGVTGQVLVSGGAGNAPAWSSPTSNTASFTASGSITAGAPVALKSAGVVEAITQTTTAAALSSVSTVQTGNPQSKTPRIVYDAKNDRFVAVSQIGAVAYVVAGVRTGNSISWGTPVAAHASGTCYNAFIFYHEAAQAVAVAYHYDSNAEVKVVTGTGTTATLGAASVMSASVLTGDGYFWGDYHQTQQRIYFVYRDSSTNIYGRAVAISLAGAITLGSQNTFSGLASSQIQVDLRCAVSGTEYLTLIGAPSGRTTINGNRLYVSGDGMSAQGNQNLPVNSGVYIGPIVGIIGSETCIFTFYSSTDGFTSIANFSANSALTASGRYGYFDANTSTTNIFNFAFFKIDGSPYGIYGQTNGRVDLYSLAAIADGGKPAATLMFALTGTGVSTATPRGAIFGNGSYVFMQNNGSTSNTAYAYTLGTKSSNFRNYIGLATSSVSDGQTVNVTTAGGVNTSVTGLTAGEVYCVSPTGTLLSGQYNYPRVGRAVSATSILAEDRSQMSGGTKSWTQFLGTSGTYTVPAGVNTIRIYAFGGGGRAYDGSSITNSWGGGGGGCAFGDYNVVPGDVITITHSSGKMTVLHSGVTLMEAFKGIDANQGTGVIGSGGAAWISGAITNGGAFPGGNGGLGINGSWPTGGGGGASGSPLGAGGNGSGYGGGGGWGNNALGYGGAGVGGGSASQSYGGGGSGGPGYATAGGIGREPTRAFIEPLLMGLNSPGDSAYFVNYISGSIAVTSASTAGPGAGGRGAYATNSNYAANGGNGGFGGGGGVGFYAGSGGFGGFGGGGGGANTGSGGYSIMGGGGGAKLGSGTPGTTGGSACVLIYA